MDDRQQRERLAAKRKRGEAALVMHEGGMTYRMIGESLGVKPARASLLADYGRRSRKALPLDEIGFVLSARASSALYYHWGNEWSQEKVLAVIAQCGRKRLLRSALFGKVSVDEVELYLKHYGHSLAA